MKRLTQFLNLKARPTTKDCIDFVIKSIREYYEDVYFDDCHENIFKVNEAGDFSGLINIYGIEGALKIAEKNLQGYVIAGYNIPLDKVISINTTNYWSIYTDMFTKEILDRILKLNEDGCPVDAIQKWYPSIDVARLLEDEKEEEDELTLNIKLKRGVSECKDCPFHIILRNAVSCKFGLNHPFDCNRYNVSTMEIVK